MLRFSHIVSIRENYFLNLGIVSQLCNINLKVLFHTKKV